MPYKDQSPWGKAEREYLKATDRTNGAHGQKQNRCVLRELKKLLGEVDPRTVKLSSMQELETKMKGNETSRAVKCTLARAFFKMSLNRNAYQWKLTIRQKPREDIIHLTEGEISHLKTTAAKMGVFYELFTSLGVDNGLRPHDMLCLTVQNAVEWLQRGWSVIRRKGRNGGKLVRHYLHADTFNPLMRYLDMRQEMSERYGTELKELFIMETNYWDRKSKKGAYHLRPIYYEVLRDEHLRLQEESGLTVKLKDERATFGFRCRMAGMPIEDTAELMAHESLTTSFRHYIGDFAELRRRNMLRIGAPPQNHMEILAEISSNPARTSQRQFER